MSRYNHHFQNHFSSCVLLARAFDPHRNRNVELRMLPGQFDVVGVTDGTDAWIAPVVSDPFRVNIARLIEDARNGKKPEIRKPRIRVLAPAEEAQPQPQTTTRRRIHVRP